MKPTRGKTNGSHDKFVQQGQELDKMLEEAKRLHEGARKQVRGLDGSTEQGTEHKVGPARGENK